MLVAKSLAEMLDVLDKIRSERAQVKEGRDPKKSMGEKAQLLSHLLKLAPHFSDGSCAQYLTFKKALTGFVARHQVDAAGATELLLAACKGQAATLLYAVEDLPVTADEGWELLDQFFMSYPETRFREWQAIFHAAEESYRQFAIRLMDGAAGLGIG